MRSMSDIYWRKFSGFSADWFSEELNSVISLPTSKKVLSWPTTRWLSKSWRCRCYRIIFNNFRFRKSILTIPWIKSTTSFISGATSHIQYLLSWKTKEILLTKHWHFYCYIKIKGINAVKFCIFSNCLCYFFISSQHSVVVLFTYLLCQYPIICSKFLTNCYSVSNHLLTISDGLLHHYYHLIIIHTKMLFSISNGLLTISQEMLRQLCPTEEESGMLMLSNPNICLLILMNLCVST